MGAEEAKQAASVIEGQEIRSSTRKDEIGRLYLSTVMALRVCGSSSLSYLMAHKCSSLPASGGATDGKVSLQATIQA